MKALTLLFVLGGNSYNNIALAIDASAKPSPNNFILYEQKSSTDFNFNDTPSPIKISTNVPLTVQRYDNINEVFEGQPVTERDGYILVTSTCDTNDSTIVPVVNIQEGIIDVQLPGVTVGSQMDFLQSSSYEASWIETGCGFYEAGDIPDWPSDSTTGGGGEVTKVEPTICLTEQDCNEMRQKMNIGAFYSGSYTTKGCYRKNDIAFWSYDDSTSAADLSTMDLPGVLERIMCQKEVTSDIPGGGGNSNPSAGEEEQACVAQSQCDNKRQEMNIDTFMVGAYPTAGCFSKNGVVYWGTGDGSLSSNPLSGSKERIWCADSSSATTPSSQVCQTGPNADPSLNCGGDNSKKYCRLDSGVCTGVGVCEVTPEMCIEIYSPVCGCDNKTYENGCKANEKGINIASKGECAIQEGVGPTVKTPCLSEQSCDNRRKELNVESFYSGTSYPSKGCFTKNGVAYWDGGGSLEDKTTADLPGSRKRIYCNANGSTSKSLVSKSNLLPQTLQDVTTTSSACSLGKPLMIGSLFNKVVSSNAKIVHERSLQTCTYNVEVLLNGCAGSGSPAQIEVDAPKARLISSVTEIVDKETVSVTEMTSLPDGTTLYSPEYQYTITMSFPDTKAQTVQVADAGNYASVTPLDQDSCWMVVCGRPFVDSSGHSLLASSFSANECDETSSSWLGGGSVLNTEESSAINNSTNQYQHDLLAKDWTHSALGEHASVASFSVFSIALMTNGAPSDLVEGALKAGLDEIKHTKISFDIASKLIGKEIRPSPLPPSSHQFDHNLTALALAVVQEGCVDETLSALAAAAEVELIDKVLENGAAEGTKYYDVATKHLVWIRNELRIIALDESNHSALAWRTFDWVCAVDADACSAAKQSVLGKDELIRAFKRRFVGVDYPSELLGQMALAWRHIIGEKSIIYSDTSLLSQLVENISRDRIL